jgi:hypothetical protein
MLVILPNEGAQSLRMNFHEIASFGYPIVVGLLLDSHKSLSLFPTTQVLARDEYEVSDITTQFIFGPILKNNQCKIGSLR